MPVLEAFVTDQPIDSDRMLLAVESPAVGAVASFYGVIRNHDPEAVSYTHLDVYKRQPSRPA